MAALAFIYHPRTVLSRDPHDFVASNDSRAQIGRMLLILLAATVAAADGTVYPVFNHERVAGSMIVKRSTDTVTVRYVFTDRNRGSRETLRSASGSPDR